MLKKVIFFLLLVFLPVSWTLASGFLVYEQGAKPAALGGAFIAKANDVSAVFYNPAGITAFKVNNFSIGGSLIIPQISFQGPENNSPEEYSETNKEIFPPAFFYSAFPVYDKLTAGFGVFSLFGQDCDWDENWVGNQLTVKSRIQTYFLNPVLAYKVLDNLSVAAGVEIVYGSILWKKRHYYSVRGVLGSAEFDDNTYGFGYNFGLQYIPFENLSIGVIYRSPVLLDFDDGDAAFTFSSSSDTINAEALYIFPDTKTQSDIELPAMFGIGISYDFFNRLTAEVDYLWTGWSCYDERKIEYIDNTIGGEEEILLEKNYEDSYSLRLGLEYRFNESLALRGGYIKENKAVPDAYVEPSMPDGDRNVYSFGIGYKFIFADLMDVSIDGYYALLMQDDREITNAVNNFNGKYKSLSNMYGVSLSWSFLDIF